MTFEGRIGDLEDIGQPWGNAGGVVKTIGDVRHNFLLHIRGLEKRYGYSTKKFCKTYEEQ